MIIKEKDKITMLCAEEGLKITDKNKSFFSDFIYVPKNYNPDNYEEVPRSVWKNYVEDEIPKNKVEELTNKIKELEEEKAELKDKLLEVEKEHGDYLLDNDLRITMLELGLA